MNNYSSKLAKIESLKDEVRELHPLLNDLLSRLPGVSRLEYTHGKDEMGADFVLAKSDEILGGDEYVGVIVKSGDIKQNYVDLERQIKECGLVPRGFDGGKKKIYISEIWVVSSGAITHNAQEKIHAEFRDKKIKFFWSETIIRLIDSHYPEYWVNIESKIGVYLSSVERSIQDLNARSQVLDMAGSDFYVEQELNQIHFDSRKRFSVRVKKKPVSIKSVMGNERFVLVQAGMGFGKSRLLRHCAAELVQHNNFASSGVLPVFVSFRDLVGKYNNDLKSVLSGIGALDGVDLGKYTIVFMIDGVDEVRRNNQEKSAAICQFISQLNVGDSYRAIIASRPIDDPISEELLDKNVSRYELQPLSFQKIVSFVERLCSKSVVTNRLRADLERSDLFKSLPRTPISAILLARVLSSNINELPSSLPELYSKYIDLALGRWDIPKGLVSEKEYETTEIISRLLSQTMMDNDLGEMSIGDVKGIISDYLSRRETGLTAADVFNSLVDRKEIYSVDHANNKMFFRHRSFMEYLYADQLFVNRGMGADIVYPFDQYWVAVNYFYFGKLKDCPAQLDKVFRVVPSSDADLLIKFVQAGQYLLAAYQSPYKDITRCVELVILEAAELYCRICENPKDSPLGVFPELQLLAVFSGLVRHSFEYDFFKKSLLEVETSVLLSVDSCKVKSVAAFFLASIRAGLGCKDAFNELATEHGQGLPWSLKLGISHASADVGLANDAIRRLEKRVSKARKGNSGLNDYLRKIYNTPMIERADIRLA